jgi:uncharacterized protein
MKERKGDWIKTHTGIHFYPFDPRIEEIDLEDIAHALSNICRFTGHTSEFYSVAQHSVRVSEMLIGKNLKMAGLFHDASEAYICDIARPVKRAFRSDNKYKIAERDIQNAIYKKFKIDPLSFTEFGQLRLADDILLFTEGKYLMGGTQDWHNPRKVIPINYVHSLSPVQAKQLFYSQYDKILSLVE